MFINIFLCGGVHTFRSILSLFLSSNGLLNIASIVLSSILIYILAKILGKIGGIILTIIGVAGTLFTAGLSLALSLVGVLIMLFERSVMIIIAINMGMYLLCMFLGCV